jgi:hypothetical protein
MKTLKTLSLVMAVALVATAKLHAGDTAPANSFFGTLSTVSPAELPAKSAELVSQADSKNRLGTTADVVKAAVGLNPAAAAAIVGTIAQSTPEMASVAAATAVALVPNQAIAIAHAAAAAAPSEAGKIVEAVCRVVPDDYREVAIAVAGVAPGAAKEILAGISAAIPALQEPINKVLVSYNGGTPAVSVVLEKISATAKSKAAALDDATITSAPHFGPPFVAAPPSPVNLQPPNGGQVVTGGRIYSSPPGP